MSPNELENIATAFQLVGQVCFASACIDPIVSGDAGFKSVLIGLVLSVGFFYSSFLLAKRINSKL